MRFWVNRWDDMLGRLRRSGSGAGWYDADWYPQAFKYRPTEAGTLRSHP